MCFDSLSHRLSLPCGQWSVRKEKQKGFWWRIKATHWCFLNISCVDLGPRRHTPAAPALSSLGELLEVLGESPGRIWGDLGKSLEGDLLEVCALQQRHFASFSCTEVSLMCLFLNWGGGKEGGIIIRHFYSCGEWGGQSLGSTRDPKSPCSGSRKAQNQSLLWCLVWFFFFLPLDKHLIILSSCRWWISWENYKR